MKYSTWRRRRQSHVDSNLSKSTRDNQGGCPVPDARDAATTKEGTEHLSMLNSWAKLSGIAATICESRSLKFLSMQRTTQTEADLLTWYSSPQNCCQKRSCQSLRQSELPFCLRPLWHHTFMTLAADLNVLEMAVGRQGKDIDASTLELVRAWICSPESRRCLLHALCLQNMVASTTVGSADAIYTARVLFSAAVCWYCYILYAPWCSAALGSDAHQQINDASDYLLTFPEIRLLRENRSTVEAHSHVLDQAMVDLKTILGANAAVMKASTLCVLESTLRRLGTSGISRTFADIIQAFVSGKTE